MAERLFPALTDVPAKEAVRFGDLSLDYTGLAEVTGALARVLRETPAPADRPGFLLRRDQANATLMR